MRKHLSLYCSILFIFCQVLVCFLLSETVSATNIDDFYFEDFYADYYLSSEDDGTSKLKVSELMTAVFPDFDQNKGICREINFLNQGGVNRTLDGLTEKDIKVYRNGNIEPIYSIEEESNYYTVCTGTNEYVRGKQTYRFEYTFHNVVTEFENDSKKWQELYWNTNGTGWSQKFNTLTAVVHFEDENVFNNGDVSCYVGAYGENGQERCHIERMNDGLKFTTYNLRSGENLTYSIELKSGSFKMPEKKYSYIMVIVFMVTTVILCLSLKKVIKNLKKTKDIREYDKGYFIKPEYTANKDYTLVESAEIYKGTKRNEKVAVLLDLVVRGKIELKEIKRTLFNQKWGIYIKDTEDLEPYECAIIGLLKGKKDFEEGELIELKKHTANRTLVALGKKFDDAGAKKCKEDKLITKTEHNLVNNSVIITILLFFAFFVLVVFPEFLGIERIKSVYYIKGEIVFEKELFSVLMLIEILAVAIIVSIIRKKYKDIFYYTKKGVEASKYMEGLKLYIKMAEKERLEFLQSTKGAPRDADGIIKLNEKLLPYAALFGLEKSWMKELSKYYEMDDIDNPDWYIAVRMYDFTTINSVVRTASSYATASSHYSSSVSDGGGFSGGGGGGFSGGGGGGGGGGGR